MLCNVTVTADVIGGLIVTWSYVCVCVCVCARMSSDFRFHNEPSERAVVVPQQAGDASSNCRPFPFHYFQFRHAYVPLIILLTLGYTVYIVWCYNGNLDS